MNSNVIKKIHQIWVGPNPIPLASLKFIEDIKKLHPDYEYKLWTDEDLTEENFLNIQFIKTAKSYAQKADIMRYEILYKHGGIYLDIDFEIFKCLTLLLTDDLVVCNEDTHTSQYITNAFIYSVPGNKNLENCVKNIVNCKLGTPDVNVQTGPWYFRKNITDFKKVKILDTVVMYPVHYNQKRFRPTLFLSETYGIHHWDKNW